MSAEPLAIGALTSENDENLIRNVLASFPRCDMTEEDLHQNPQFCRLLASLSHHVDKTGLTASVKKELEKAEQNLKTQRRIWLQSEGLHRALLEMIQDHTARKAHAAVTPDENMFYETMERCLLVAKCAKLLDPSNTTEKDKPSILGLTPQQVMELMPSENNIQKMKATLPGALEEHLKKKCCSFLSYYEPEWDDQSESLKLSKFSHLPAKLQDDQKKAAALEESTREKKVLIQRVTEQYLSEMTKCVQIMQSFILENHLKVQADLDKMNLDYLEGKCELSLQKIMAEIAAIRLETYTPDTISAHKEIRKHLESELSTYREEKRSMELKLSSFEVLGKDFEALVEEYGKIREEIELKNWAIEELSKFNEK
ncbi:HAUS augmin-like complex subunit 4 isoform X1 [Corythoichthys intestinalis]|uniref:HAUS augmin-like complex subunit 4 isoform X1 n=2 Tax=Corythoichthys intestinalis TaxID=161448 RepID=UPI0025A629C3|nr:HAUS augmin-like complex subunit 4 isoform X1 [Corythoichthys intestinalis]XP_057711001.1 HAUS augmin-like complex subunit 4 isoform X1 [Corythoichthys intestinalis]